MEEHLVSIIIPAYNVEKYVGNCLDSVNNQSYKNIEIIIINDFSTDMTNNVILQKTNNISNTRYINNTNNYGVGEVRNIGLSESHGEFILFLDGDDWIEIDFIKKMVDSILINKTDIVISNTINEYGNYINSKPRYLYNYNYTLTHEYALKLLSRSIKNTYYLTPMVGCKLFRKDLLVSNKLNFIKNNRYEDDVFSFLAFIYSNNISIVSDTYQYYRQHPNSITHTFSKKSINELIEAFLYLKKCLEDKKIFEKYNVEYKSFFERCIYTTYNTILELNCSVDEKKSYIKYFIKEILQYFSIQDFIDYIDIERIEKFLGF